MDIRKAHFIGIAGAGMSATAKLLLDKGIAVSGSDQDIYPPVSDFLRLHGIACRTPYAAENLPADAELIVIGKNAKLVPETNAEVAAAYGSGRMIMSFPEVLGALSEGKDTVVVAGSYGKSTSAALLAHCLESLPAEAGDGLDPSFFIGAIPLTPSTNARLGTGRLFVLEGDEYPSSNTDARSKFLHYHPRHLLITPLAHDHLNVFPTPDDYVKPFHQLVRLMPSQGTIVACQEGPLSQDLLSAMSRPVTTYGVYGGEFHAAGIAWGEQTRFTLMRRDAPIVTIATTQLGEHNIQNIVGVAALLLSLGIAAPEQIATAVATFRGIRRRLDRKSEKTSIPIFEGFGSSYDKARSAIAAMRRHFPERRLIVVFEPHTFSWRNRNALAWYDDVFEGAAKVFIYEPADQGAATHQQISQAVILERVLRSGCDAEAISDPDEAMRAIDGFLQPNDAVLLLTSGNLGGLIDRVPAAAEQKFPRL
jgi:UDP-N-acetylmuramate: L-alanyl-gamma-D-glutamyl-meso-diaminopimelate ligase